MKENFKWQEKKRTELINYFTSLIYFVLLLISIESCTNDPNKKEAKKNALTSSETQIEHVDSANLVMSTRLDILYLNNTADKPQLDILMKRSNSKEKLICQFYLRSNGKITMGVYPSNKKNQGIDHPNVQLLTNDRYSGLDVSRGELYFGDQEIIGTAYSTLFNLVNEPGSEFIVFTPKLIGKHIAYEIKSGSRLLALNPISIGFTNPSPPKDADVIIQ